MMKRLALGLAMLLLVAVAAVALLARSVLTGDHVRQALAAQLSRTLGQPVTVGSVEASLFPRLTVDLTDVSIGQPSRIHLEALHVGTSLRALFSRRIEHAAVRVDGARIELPLPDLKTGTPDATPAAPAVAPPIRIVSIDEIVLINVEILSGGRALHGDIELVPQGDGVALRRVSLVAGDTALEMTGVLTSLNPVEGRIDAAAREADLDRLLMFLSDFASTAESTPASAAADSALGELIVHLSIDRATTGGLAVSNLTTRAVVTPHTATLDPLALGLFGGRYEGALSFTMDEVPRFAWRGTLTDLDASRVMTFAQTPDTISGRLAGTLALEGEGLAMEQALRTARGTVRVDISDGAIASLGLVRTIVTATSGRGGLARGAQTAAASRADADAEQFSRLGATLAFAGGRMATRDFTLTSPDVEVTGAGTVTLADMTVEMAGRARLSEALSKEAGTDLYRYTQEAGRVTVPATITGPLDDLTVRLDFGDAASRALRNRAAEEAQRILERNLPRLPVPRRPPGP
jgi:uncharacterized protein involved in outer membrane biogenesis